MAPDQVVVKDICWVIALSMMLLRTGRGLAMYNFFEYVLYRLLLKIVNVRIVSRQLKSYSL